MSQSVGYHCEDPAQPRTNDLVQFHVLGVCGDVTFNDNYCEAISSLIELHTPY